MPFDPDIPYNDLPLLPPKAELETKAVLRKAIAANKALAELKGAGDLIPYQGVLINVAGSQAVAQRRDRASNNAICLARHMFARRTYFEDMSKNAGFLHISRKHVQDLDVVCC